MRHHRCSLGSDNNDSRSGRSDAKTLGAGPEYHRSGPASDAGQSLSSGNLTKTRRPTLRTIKRLTVALAVLAVLYALAGFRLAPYLLERAVVRYDARTPRRSVAVARVTVNPFTMVVELDGFAFRDLDAGIDLTAETTRLNLSIATLISGRIVLDALTVDGVRLLAAAPNWRSRLGTVLHRLAARAAAKPPALRIARLQLSGGRIDLGTARARSAFSLRDIALSCAARAEDGRLQLSAVRASGRGLELTLSERAALSAATLSADFDAAVTARPGGFAVRADTMLRGTGVEIADASTPAAAAVRFRALSAKLRAQYGDGSPNIAGTASADGLLVKGAGRDGASLSADHVGVFALAATGTPGAVDIDRVRLSGIAGTIDVAPVAEPALPGWLRQAVDPYAAPVSGAPPRLAIGRVEVEGGALELTDTSVDPHPSLRLQRVKGTLSGLRRGNEPAVVQLQAALGDDGAVTMTARLGPHAPDGFSRVEIRADGVDAAALSPYARRFAASPVQGGRLSGDLTYRISGARVLGSARLAVHGLELGTGDGAADRLPLAMAAALLDDPQGDIELTVPVDAAADRPDPYMPAIVGGALAAAISQTVAAPFDVLARLVGSSADSLRAVPFEPGSAAITAAAKAGLMRLADALAQRPGLAVAVAGGFDAGADHKALAAQEIRLHVALATASADQFDAAQLGEPPPIDFASPRVQSVLDEFAGQRLGKPQIATLAARFPKAGGAAPADRTSYYHALFDALVAQQAVSEQALKRLGRYRAQSVVEALTGLGIAAARVRHGGVPAPVAAPDGGAASVSVPLVLRSLASDPQQTAAARSQSASAIGQTKGL